MHKNSWYNETVHMNNTDN